MTAVIARRLLRYRMVGLVACPFDAIEEVKEYVENEAGNGFVTECTGGRGSVREVVDMILDINKLGDENE